VSPFTQSLDDTDFMFWRHTRVDCSLLHRLFSSASLIAVKIGSAEGLFVVIHQIKIRAIATAVAS
jgi:hypothetical protein